jgi:hypothetical protein
MSPDGQNLYIASLNANSVTVFDRDAKTPQTTVNSTAGEVVTFNNPTSSLTINSGVGNNIINFDSIAVGFAADITINGGTGDDTVNFNGDITFAAGKSLDVDLQNDSATPGTDTVTFGANSNLILTGAGTATAATGGFVGGT